MKRVMVHLVMVCVVFLLFSCMGTTPGPSEPTSYTIQGVVKKWNGEPLQGVTISAGGVSTTSDSQGRWSISGLSGTVVVSAQLQNYYIVVNGTHYATSTQTSDAKQINFTAYDDVNDKFGGGTGTQDDPYIIVNVRQLNRVRDDLQAHYRQIRDLDLNDLRLLEDNGSSDPTPNWYPIGLIESSSYLGFLGSYDGSGFSIKNMIIYTGFFDGAGMFMHLSGATLKNIVVENSIIITNNECTHVGVIASRAVNSTIDNVHVYNSQFDFRRTSYFVGALIGWSSASTITDCSAVGINVKLAGREYDVIRSAGGFVGVTHYSSTFENCSVEATVTGTFWSVGGFAGSSYLSIFKNCDSKVKLKGKLMARACMGGFVGDVRSSVFQDCHVLFGSSIELLDSQSDNNYIGGFVGKAEDTAPDMVEFKQCSVDITIEGSVTNGASYLGGFAGKVFNCSVKDCDVETTLRFAGNNITYAGGFAGYSAGSSFSGCDVSDATLSVDNCTQVGGFAGEVRDSDIATCTFDGQLIIEPVGGNGYVAGFVAYALAQSENRYLSSCTVHSGSSITLTATPTTTQYIGGLIGYGSGQSDSIKLIVSNNHVRISLDAPESQNIQSDPLIAQNNGNVELYENDAQWEQ